MVRYSLASVLALLLAGACDRSPTSPGLVAPFQAGQELFAKPGGGGPTPSTHDLIFGPSMFGDLGSDGLPSPGHIEAVSPAAGVQGWFSGPNPAGNYLASASGTYTWTITDVDELPDKYAGGDPCQEDEQQFLRDQGLVATAVAGSLSLTVGEDTTGNVQGPTFNATMTVSTLGYTWKIVARNGSSDPLFQPHFDGSEPGQRLQVTIENAPTQFTRTPVGARKSDLFIACRSDFTMVMTKR